jgi:hypothetical protein
VKLTTHLRLVPRSKNGWSCTSTHPIRLHGVVLRGSTGTSLPYMEYGDSHVLLTLDEPTVCTMLTSKNIMKTSYKPSLEPGVFCKLICICNKCTYNHRAEIPSLNFKLWNMQPECGVFSMLCGSLSWRHGASPCGRWRLPPLGEGIWECIE